MKRFSFVFFIHVLTLSCTAAIDVCVVDEVSDDTGTVTSPGYDGTSKYPPNQDCNLTISTTNDKVILVTFVSMDLEFKTACTTDWMAVYDGSEQYTGVNFCWESSSTLPHNFVSSASSVTVVFHSDSSPISGTGFQLEWTTQARCAGFTCWSGDCVEANKKCNGVKHCPDDSDEIECVQTSSSSGQCGKVATAPSFTWDARIAGGNEAAAGSWPWQAALFTTSGTIPFCGGSIISNSWILTSGRCVASYEDTPANMRVDVGKHTTTGGADQTSVAQQVILHQSLGLIDYYGSNVAVVQMASPLTFNSLVRPICFPQSDFTVDDKATAIMTGFGKLTPGTTNPDNLYQVRVPIIGNSECDTIVTHQSIGSNQLCAGDTTKGGIDFCEKDQGGPLVMLVRESTWFQIGIASNHQSSCADSRYPGIYMRVSYYQSWIESTTSLTAATTPQPTTTAEATTVAGETTATTAAQPTTATTTAQAKTATTVAQPTTATTVVQETTATTVAKETTAPTMASATTATTAENETTATTVAQATTATTVAQAKTVTTVAQPTTATTVAQETTATTVAKETTVPTMASATTVTMVAKETTATTVAQATTSTTGETSATTTTTTPPATMAVEQTDTTTTTTTTTSSGQFVHCKTLSFIKIFTSCLILCMFSTV